MYKPPWMQILLLYYMWIYKRGAHFPVGAQIDPSNKNNSNDIDGNLSMFVYFARKRFPLISRSYVHICIHK